MSSSHATSSNAIPIPDRKAKGQAHNHRASGSTSSPGASFQYSSYGSPSSASSSPGQSEGVRKRRESLMSPNFSAASHTVINIGEETRPRLISCVKESQGFDWNQEIFLPSYADFHFDTELERRQDPVAEIRLTEEEVKGMFPE